jgi:hypothetical protein
MFACMWVGWVGGWGLGWVGAGGQVAPPGELGSAMESYHGMPQVLLHQPASRGKTAEEHTGLLPDVLLGPLAAAGGMGGTGREVGNGYRPRHARLRHTFPHQRVTAPDTPPRGACEKVYVCVRGHGRAQRAAGGCGCAWVWGEGSVYMCERRDVVDAGTPRRDGGCGRDAGPRCCALGAGHAM